jgi:hypothetical protein
MCSIPVAAALILATAETGYQYYGEQQQAKSNARFQDQAAKEGQALAKESFQQQQTDIQNRAQEQNEATAQQIGQVKKEASQARSQARVASGEAGVAGLSVDALLADFSNQESDSISTIKRNSYFQRRQLQQEQLGIRAQGMNQLASTRYAPIRGPSAIGAGLSIAGSSLSAYNKYNTKNGTVANAR